jgi:hypothetical protein
MSGRRYLSSDIVELKRRSFDGVRTAILVAGLTAGVIVVAYGVAMASLVSGL